MSERDTGAHSSAEIPVKSLALAPSAFAPSLGGVEELVRQMAHEQERRGGSSVVVTMRWPHSLPEEETIEGTPVRRFVLPAPGRRPDRLARFMTRASSRTSAVAQVLADRQVDLVHVQCVSPSAWYVARAARQRGLPLVVSLQGELSMDADGAYEHSWFLRRTLKRLMRTADAVTACSRSTLDEATSWAGLDLGARGSVVPNGVRAAELIGAAPHEHPRRYAFATGRHVHNKGFDVLVDAFAEIERGGGSPWDLLLAGSGPDFEALRARCLAAGLEGRVHLLGRVDRATTARLLMGCEAVIVPSRQEPFGIVNLEAMASGRPVIASDVGGIPEIVQDGSTGLLVPPGRTGALASAILALANDAELRRSLGEAASAAATAFEWQHIMEQYDEVHRRAIRSRAPRP
jgi:glycosyltransferase involved in cell wall biosynthesis